MKFIFSSILCLFLFSCNKASQKKQTGLPFLPNEASLILKVTDLKEVQSLLQNNALLQQNKTNQLYQFFRGLEPLNTIQSSSDNFYLCFSPLGKNDLGFTLLVNAKKTEITIAELDKYFVTDRTYTNFLYKEFKINEQSVFATQLDNSWVLTSDYLLMENHIKQFENSIPYKYPKAIESLNDQTLSLIIVNTELKDISNRLFPNLPNKHLLKKELTGWTAGDFSIDKNTLDFSAIYKPKTDRDFSIIFKNTNPQNNRLAEITPVNANQFTSFSFEAFEILAENLLVYNRKAPTKPNNKAKFLAETTELGTIQLSKSQFFACRIPNESIELATYFNYGENPTVYRDVSIYKLDNVLNFDQALKPLVSESDYQFFIQFKEFVIFSKSINNFKELIPSLKSEKTLYNTPWYQKFSNQLTAQSSMLTVANINYAHNELKKSLLEENQKKWKETLFKDYKAVAFQMVSEESFSHVHLVTSKTTEQKKDFTVNETENVILSNTIQSKPQFTTNYISKTKDIVVQDEKNQLIVISNKGEIRWKKAIGEPILGEIQQMDMYRNGRLQYVFTTPTTLYVLDRNGKDATPFPLKFKSKITQPVSVFDYDKNRKYRIVITQNTLLTMYDSRGKEVKGFNFDNKAKGEITTAPKHIRVAKKDFIVVNDINEGVHFLSRTGKERVQLKQTVPKTEQEWFWYNNAFSTLNIDNSITQIKTDGSVLTKDAKLPIPGAVATATAKTWVSFAENSLSIKNKIIELEFGKYTAPKIFYIRDKIYVSVTNIDSKKVYLFDSNAKSIKGFPVFGTGEATIENIDKDNYLELIVKGDENSILFYEFR